MSEIEDLRTEITALRADLAALRATNAELEDVSLQHATWLRSVLGDAYALGLLDMPRMIEAVAALREENARLATEHTQCHKWNGDLVHEHYALRAQLADAGRVIEGLREEVITGRWGRGVQGNAEHVEGESFREGMERASLIVRSGKWADGPQGTIEGQIERAIRAEIATPHPPERGATEE